MKDHKTITIEAVPGITDPNLLPRAKMFDATPAGYCPTPDGASPPCTQANYGGESWYCGHDGSWHPGPVPEDCDHEL